MVNVQDVTGTSQIYTGTSGECSGCHWLCLRYILQQVVNVQDDTSTSHIYYCNKWWMFRMTLAPHRYILQQVVNVQDATGTSQIYILQQVVNVQDATSTSGALTISTVLYFSTEEFTGALLDHSLLCRQSPSRADWLPGDSHAERWGGVHMGFSRHLNTISNRTEHTLKASSPSKVLHQGWGELYFFFFFFNWLL